MRKTKYSEQIFYSPDREKWFITHVVLIACRGDLEVMGATSYEDALRQLRERAKGWLWDLDPDHPLDREQADVEQLSTLYAFAEDEATTWVTILPVWPSGKKEALEKGATSATKQIFQDVGYPESVGRKEIER